MVAYGMRVVFTLTTSRLVKHRVDFEQLAARYYDESLTHSGIIVAVRRPATELVLRLLKVLDRFTADEMKNQLIYV